MNVLDLSEELLHGFFVAVLLCSKLRVTFTRPAPRAKAQRGLEAQLGGQGTQGVHVHPLRVRKSCL